jgi:ferredoxin
MKDMKAHLVQSIRDFTMGDRSNWFDVTGAPFCDEPLVGFASAADPLFEQFKTVVSPEHLTPKEAFELELGEGTFVDGTVISVVFPLEEKIRASNRGQKSRPSDAWVLNRSFGVSEVLGSKVMHRIGLLLAEQGFRTVAPTQAVWFRKFRGSTGPCSNWSERHIAYAAGLGTFGLNEGFITEKGIAVRLMSVVTDCVIAPDAGKTSGYLDNCLYYQNKTCGACIRRCPVGAITEAGHDKMKCYVACYGEESQKISVELGGDPQLGAGCGFCQTGVPCEFKNPITR